MEPPVLACQRFLQLNCTFPYPLSHHLFPSWKLQGYATGQDFKQLSIMKPYACSPRNPREKIQPRLRNVSSPSKFPGPTLSHVLGGSKWLGQHPPIWVSNRKHPCPPPAAKPVPDLSPSSSRPFLSWGASSVTVPRFFRNSAFLLLFSFFVLFCFKQNVLGE